MSDQCTEQSFLKDVAEHHMTVLRDDGVNRHVRFMNPNSSNLHFDLVTWPGHLCYTGDMGTYVFHRLDDMFVFFRTDRRQPPEGQTLFTNLGYWGEKVEAVSRFGNGIKEYNRERFACVINERVEEYIEEGGIGEEAADGLRQEVENQVLLEDEFEYTAHTAARGFEHQGFTFQDFWEVDLTEYTYHFTWCCYAIAWGVGKYDTTKAETPV